jgi:molybdate transport system regulatory protein
MKNHQPTVRLHLWLEQDGQVFFGTGRVLLLNKIEEYGSIKKAAEALGMSYRAAWGKIKATEKLLGVRLIEYPRHKRDGCRLSLQGRELRDRFDAWFRQVEQDANEKAGEIFPWPVKSFVDTQEGK